MMLPTGTAANNHEPILVGLLGASSQVIDHLAKLAPGNVAILHLDEDLVESGTLTTCDCLIAVLDGDLGVSPALINAWAQAVDHDISRIVLAINTVTGRADFDEAIALSELVLNEDIAMRYYPIQDDVEPKYVGLLDVLTHEILQPGKPPIPADLEHVNLTADEHEELVDLLAHADLSDGIFESHTSGMPVSLPRLRQLWQSSDLVTVLPIDQWVSDGVLIDWLTSRTANWLPIVIQNDIGQSIELIDQTVGIGIGPGVARLWHLGKTKQLELRTESAEIISLTGDKPSNLLFDHRIRTGDTIRPANTNYLVTTPSM